jgi:hypothetical protein
MSDDDHPSPLTDEVVAGMAEEGGVEELAAEVVIPSKGRKPRVATAERKRTRQFGMYVPVGVKLDIPKVHACSKRGEIERFTYFHTEESHFTQQVFIFWVEEPWNKGRCIAFMARMGGLTPIFKIGNDKHASIEKQFRHNAEQKQMKLNMAQVCLWREFQGVWFAPILTCTSLVKVQVAGGGDEDAFLAAGAGAAPPPPIFVVARELTNGERVVEFLKSGSPELEFIVPILAAAFHDVKEGYDILSSFSTVRVLQFGRELESLIVRAWAPTTGTAALSEIMGDGFLDPAEMDKLDDGLRESVLDCIKRRPTITDILHPMLNTATWAVPLIVELVSVLLCLLGLP